MPLSAKDIFQSRWSWPAHLQKEITYRKPETKGGVGSLEVKSYHALVRTIGYCWFRSESSVLLRGQTKCYRSLAPSASRSTDPAGLIGSMDAFLDRFRAATNFDTGPIFQRTTEPTLQHYGLRTRWLDLVDSIPHALFFATHRLVTSPFDPSKKAYIKSPKGEGVIYVIDVGDITPASVAGSTIPGLFDTDWGGTVCDLRRAKPSHALRPHAQHGWLCRGPDGKLDLWDRVILRIFFNVADARPWIDGALSVEPEGMFPPPSWDEVFKMLISEKVNTFLTSERATGLDLGEILNFDFH
ncbi:FRG domain-containing protein [Corallococcus exercitus]|uniref:FRG domain-containing protein n=1 Tax=Corallococcus exercitus TaxID=2316736 RepID=A0A7Y4JQ21_9BACT|nr:FRG domain-containing protein [Corallococcus exercitus]